MVADRAALEAGGFAFEPVRAFEAFVEALVRDSGGATVLVQWVRESAYRFVPLVEHADLGLVLLRGTAEAAAEAPSPSCSEAAVGATWAKPANRSNVGVQPCFLGG